MLILKQGFQITLTKRGLGCRVTMNHQSRITNEHEIHYLVSIVKFNNKIFVLERTCIHGFWVKILTLIFLIETRDVAHEKELTHYLKCSTNLNEEP